jgi:epoxyqueuosine reductase QueG
MLVLGAVLTDIDLPSDPPAKSICIENCSLCIRNCPVQALNGRSAIQKRCRPNTYGVNARGYETVNCNRCRTCEKVCPKSNIKVGEKPEFLHRCEGCYACIHHCPQKAIHLRSEKSSTRFINGNVKLKEIIDANNQYNSNVQER